MVLGDAMSLIWIQTETSRATRTKHQGQREFLVFAKDLKPKVSLISPFLNLGTRIVAEICPSMASLNCKQTCAVTLQVDLS